MKNILLSKLLIISSAIVLTACGGGNSSSSSSSTSYYGSIYVNTVNGAGGITANYKSQGEADIAAYNLCTTYANNLTGCMKLVDFGTAMCGALARSINSRGSYIFGTGTSSAAELAQALAITQCVGNGGTNCQIGLSLCNDNGKSNSSLFGVVKQSDTDLAAIKNGEIIEQGGALGAELQAFPTGENNN